MIRTAAFFWGSSVGVQDGHARVRERTRSRRSARRRSCKASKRASPSARRSAASRRSRASAARCCLLVSASVSAVRPLKGAERTDMSGGHADTARTLRTRALVMDAPSLVEGALVALFTRAPALTSVLRLLANVAFACLATSRNWARLQPMSAKCSSKADRSSSARSLSGCSCPRVFWTTQEVNGRSSGAVNGRVTVFSCSRCRSSAAPSSASPASVRGSRRGL